jgi:hypothetical protein
MNQFTMKIHQSEIIIRSMKRTYFGLRIADFGFGPKKILVLLNEFGTEPLINPFNFILSLLKNSRQALAGSLNEIVINPDSFIVIEF